LSLDFLLSSGRRIIDFDLKTKYLDKTNAQSHLTIDGRSGPCSLPLKLAISWQPLTSLPLEDQAEVWRTKRQLTGIGAKTPSPDHVAIIPENDHDLGERLESWAIRYSCKFSRFYSKRYPTAYAFNVGWTYASKKLPEVCAPPACLTSNLISDMHLARARRPSFEMCCTSVRLEGRRQVSRLGIPHHPSQNRHALVPPLAHSRVHPIRRTAQNCLEISRTAQTPTNLASSLYPLAANALDMSPVFSC
jgi:hypothetical protein